MPEKYVAEGVAQGLLNLYNGDMAGLKVLLPRAREARDVLPEALAAAGAVVDVLPVYETRPSEQRKDDVLAKLEAGEIHCITFGSSSTVINFLSLIPADTLKKYPAVKFACIGPITAATLEKAGLPCHIQPADFTIPALARELAEKL